MNEHQKIEVVALDDPSSDFSLVEMKLASNGVEYPYCKKHGAMNKITPGINGMWRCLCYVTRTKIVLGNSISYKENDNPCRAAAKQVSSIPKQ